MKTLVAFLVMLTMTLGTILLLLFTIGLVVEGIKTNKLSLFMGGVGVGWVCFCSLLGAISFYDDLPNT